jgi:hypothetical protein
MSSYNLGGRTLEGPYRDEKASNEGGPTLWSGLFTKSLSRMVDSKMDYFRPMWKMCGYPTTMQESEASPLVDQVAFFQRSKRPPSAVLVSR